MAFVIGHYLSAQFGIVIPGPRSRKTGSVGHPLQRWCRAFLPQRFFQCLAYPLVALFPIGSMISKALKTILRYLRL
jgi:hypothetical protein